MSKETQFDISNNLPNLQVPLIAQSSNNQIELEASVPRRSSNYQLFSKDVIHLI